MPYGQLSIGVPKETFTGEQRVAVTPDGVKTLLKKGFRSVTVEAGAGSASNFPDAAYSAAGATIAPASASDIVLRVRPPTLEQAKMKQGQTLISFLYPATNKELVEELRLSGATSFAMDAVPRISRAQVGYPDSDEAHTRSSMLSLLWLTPLVTVPSSRPVTSLVVSSLVRSLRRERSLLPRFW